ncbi:hypothetical protein A7X67_16215 [Clostridium sp. W14A]|nr:hypothetical protein A7X67_16215 [Clostridium sp. W14A]
MRRSVENPVQELQRAFDQWDALHEHGGHDPFWSDGVNLNLERNHILYYKGRIEWELPPKDYPAIYQRPTPPQMPDDYMARADEIRAGAKAALARYLGDKDYQFLLSRVERLNPLDAKNLCIRNVVGYAKGLEAAIREDDLITMRRHENPDTYLESFAECARRVRELKPRENEQMSLFYDDFTEEKESGGSSMEMRL